MIKEAINKIQELVVSGEKVETVVDGFGNEYLSKGDMFQMSKEMIYHQDKLYLSSLQGIVDYINQVVDPNTPEVLIQITEPTQVLLYNALDNRNRRNMLLQSEARIPHFSFDKFMDKETFIINLMTKFLPTNDYSYLIDLVSHISIEAKVELEDNGVSQKIGTTKGVITSEQIIKPRVMLQPIKTFIEIAQPTAEFVFRIKEVQGEVQCGLFQADGDLWKISTIADIKTWMETFLTEEAKLRTKILM